MVLGGGVIGVTTAYFLARQGVEVTVLDRQPGPAMETSQANAGQVSPGYSTPWAAPGIPLKALKWLVTRHAPLAIRPDGTRFQLEWMAAMLANCTSARYAINKARMLRLSTYSRDVLAQVREETGIAYEGRRLGTLQVFRKSAQLEAAARDIAVLRELGVAYELLDAGELAAVEPALAKAPAHLVGALRLPGDETGDCRLFTEGLARRCADLGVRFEYGARVDALCRSVDRVEGVVVDGRLRQADRYVLALGSYSTAIARQIGLSLPVYPLKGYSLTIPITSSPDAPVSTVMDETYKVAITRFDDRIRVGGMAEIAGFDLRLNERRRATLEMVVSSLFPRGGDVARASFWTGLRPMTPDGTPVIGATPLRNLLLNTGHGTLGWTMACGSGKFVADLTIGRRPEIDPEGLDISRYERGTARRRRPVWAPAAG